MVVEANRTWSWEDDRELEKAFVARPTFAARRGERCTEERGKLM